MTTKKQTTKTKTTGKKPAAKKQSEPKSLEVIFILDRSGSMSGLEDDTIGGFNRMLADQKALEGEVTWSTVLFDHLSEVVHDRVPVEKVASLNEDTYFVRGSTALLDAVGGAVHHIGNVHKYARPEDVPEKTLVVITTDGMENASCYYDYRQVKEMISRQQEKYGWEFVFLGANIDAAEAAGRIGIAANRAARYEADAAGTGVVYNNLSEIAMNMRVMGSVKEEAIQNIQADYDRRGGGKKGKPGKGAK